ncbi:P-loop containing nucleoside triphosphate hydrolase protein [Rhizopus microsporus var. microsporus]|uniref:Translation initiation regulator n=2 Tax=Rhizopus microsporus TaxID=58291 RepID=A0A2G4ST09_RHIZD|nr:translation initiation regulator [Rhizopus microsporus ATCC 52813]ORE10104.1 P-loop containing nucleoside triphosphate hydrolase protein [Rhizopus microsporus var. microsporus]PHZ11885.1 translation initiation regulator [Rhizopus microsporus ATCC 52813]
MSIQLIRKAVPEADEAIIEYIDGYLRENDFEDDEDAIADFVKPILIDAGGEEDKIDELCEHLSSLLQANKNSGAKKGLSKLERSVNMSQQNSLSATVNLTRGSADLEHVSGRRVQSQVNQEKLRKAEAKIAAKMAKRQEKSNLKIEYEASRLLDEQKALQEQYKLYNPILDYTTTKGKNKDIKIENFDISFAGRRILTDANLTLAFGRRYGVVGKNGIGKSTLLRAMARREIAVPQHISILYVEQEVVGDDTPAIEMVLRADVWREHLLEKERDISGRINAIEAQQKDDDMSESDREALENEKNQLNTELQEVFSKLSDIESDKAESKASAILAGLGFDTSQQKRPTREFSGGWRMRISLARALFCKPDVLMLDEPDNMLDIPAIIWLESYLKTWPNTLLVVSHDREFLDEVATDILYMHSEKLDYYKGNFTNFHATKEERRKAQLREYESQQEYRKHLQDFIDRWRYNAKRAPQAQSKIKILEKLPVLEPPEDEKIVTFQFPNPDNLSPPILQMSDVTFGYTPEKTIIRDVNIDLRMDSRIAVVGPNGAGKSTMLKLLTEENKPTQGLVHRNGRLRIAYFTQHHIDQLDLTKNAVAFMADRFPGKTEEEYRRHLGSFGITGMVSLQVMKTLSGGQKSRVAFACLSLQNPHILVLDEPTNHLDMESIDALQTALAQFKGGVIIVSHDERFINTVCNEIWICEGGVLKKFSGTIKDYKEMICPKDTP